MNYWEILHSSERDQIKALIRSDREDARWIKAVALTREAPPEEILFQVFKEQHFFENQIEHIVSKFPVELLRDCLTVYCGFPQPMWWLAVHHRNRSFWGRVIRYILVNAATKDYDICLEEFLSHGVNGFSEDWEDWEEIWTQMCDAPERREAVVNALLFNTARASCNIYYTNRLWSILIESFENDENETELVKLVAADIELLQRTGHREDLFEILGIEFINKLIPEIQPDYLIISMIKGISDNPFFSTEDINKAVELARIVASRKPIRFFGTFNYLTKVSEDNRFTEEDRNRIRGLPDTIYEIGTARLDERKDEFEYKLPNWIGVN